VNIYHHECQECGLILLFVAVEAELHRDGAEGVVRTELDRSLQTGVKLMTHGQPISLLAIHESLDYHQQS